MKWPSRKLRWRVFLVAFVVYTAAVVIHLKSPTEMKEIGQDKLSPRYQFLMFPAGNVALYQSTQLDPENVLGKLDRAVGVSHAEFVSGVVAVNVPPGQMAYARVPELTLLPASDAPGLVARWQENACPESSTCNWKVKALDNGVSRVWLSIADHKHARSARFRYETDGFRLTRVYVAERRTAFDRVEAIAVYLGACLITLIGCIVVFRGPKGGARVSDRDTERKSRAGLNAGTGAVLGAGIGAAIGTAIGNIAVGVGVGVALGVAFGAAIGAMKKG